MCTKGISNVFMSTQEKEWIFNLYEKIWKSLIRSDMIDVMNSEMFFVFPGGD
jgi:hypothetical protein